MSQVAHRTIEKVPDRCGGRAVVAGTRIRSSVTLTCHCRGTTVREIFEHSPQVRTADVHDDTTCAVGHPAEIDADLEAGDESVARRVWPAGKVGIGIRYLTDEDIYGRLAIRLRATGFDAP